MRLAAPQFARNAKEPNGRLTRGGRRQDPVVGPVLMAFIRHIITSSTAHSTNP
jgi:hypothetical protein